MATARFTIRPGLADFLALERRGRTFPAECARAATLKNAIEALGVPHTEVATIRVNGAPATLNRIVRDDDAIELLGWSDAGIVQPSVSLEFVADAHLGGLARYLRMLGFDVVHDNAIADVEIRRMASDERRIVLTRDRELLKCRDILIGCYVRAFKAEEQLREVVRRFGLTEHARPFTRCLRCNTVLEEIEKHRVLSMLPESVARDQQRFYHCRSCGRVYWAGSHYRRMQAALDRMLQ
ncbi:MAG: twitching motility protein PilT [Betaproteobacteria bacterium]|nr:MAG: twitching motility protein PilT [Betaproteobacteria bacterium]